MIDICTANQWETKNSTRLIYKSDIFLEPVEVCFPIVLRIFFEIGSSTKGQLISKCPFGLIISTKKPTIFFGLIKNYLIRDFFDFKRLG